jgi:hypothetical protein
MDRPKRPWQGVSSEWTRPKPTVKPAIPGGKPLVFTVFYGYPAELVAEWCGVSLATARLYKAGKRKPSKPVVKLFLLHRDRRVLGPEWNGWIVKPGSIVDPDNNETSRSQLHNYFWIVQLARRLSSECEDARAGEEFERLLGAG